MNTAGAFHVSNECKDDWRGSYIALLHIHGENMRSVIDEVRCGRHSNVPVCCIAAYILQRYTWPVDGTIRKWIGRPKKIYFSSPAHSHGYHACWLCCLRKHFVEMKPCDCYDFKGGRHARA